MDTPPHSAAGSPSSMPQQEGSHGESLSKHAPGASPAQLLNPPPPSFQRTPAFNAGYHAFEPMTVPAFGRNLDGGFSSAAPSSATQPHPFISHDVMAEDWARFVADMKTAGSVSMKEKVGAHVVGPAVGFAFPPAMLMARAIEQHKKKKKQEPVSELLWHWNEHFFRPRAMSVVLMQCGSSPNTPGAHNSGARERISEHRKGRREKRETRRAARLGQSDGELSDSSSDDEHSHPGTGMGHGSHGHSPGSVGRGRNRWCLQIRYQPLGSAT